MNKKEYDIICDLIDEAFKVLYVSPSNTKLVITTDNAINLKQQIGKLVRVSNNEFASIKDS